MQATRTGILGVLAALLWVAPAPAQTSAVPPLMTQAVQNDWLQFQITNGRIELLGTRGNNLSGSSSHSNVSEKLSIRSANGLDSSATYTRSGPKEEISLSTSSPGQISLRREVKNDPMIAPVEFSQVSGQLTTLTIGTGSEKRVYQAPTVWHLFIAHRAECQQHLAPLFLALHPKWDLAPTADAIERELLRSASMGQLPDRKRWADLVAQLADDRFFMRNRADRELREGGTLIQSYLESLDFQQLDAEQQYRVQQIIASLAIRVSNDTPSSFAPRLAANVDTWLALLSRPDEPTRRTAAQAIEVLLGEPIRFDPAAEPDVRETQIQRLRTRIGQAS